MKTETVPDALFPILLYSNMRIVVRKNAYEDLWEIVPQGLINAEWQDQGILEGKFVEHVDAVIHALDLSIEYMFSSDGQMERLGKYRAARKKWRK